MQSRRLWTIVLVTGVAALLTMFLTDRPEGGGDPIPGDATIPEIGDRLATAGLGCEAVIRNEPAPPGERNELGTLESALCSVGASENLEGSPVHALIIVYDNDRDERGPNSNEPAGHALIYGDRWEVWVPERQAALSIADALGGRLQLPDEFAKSPTAPTSTGRP